MVCFAGVRSEESDPKCTVVEPFGREYPWVVEALPERRNGHKAVAAASENVGEKKLRVEVRTIARREECLAVKVLNDERIGQTRVVAAEGEQLAAVG